MATKTTTTTKNNRSTTTKAPVALLPNLGIPEDDRAGIVDVFKTLLADETVLYLKLRNYHWNVTGLHFAPLHALFEDQYTQLAEVIDDVAERIRQYGVKTPGTMAEYLKLTRLSEASGYPDAPTMIADLVADHEALVRNLRADEARLDDDYDDVGAEDFLTGLLQQHQKMAWLLRAHLEA